MRVIDANHTRQGYRSSRSARRRRRLLGDRQAPRQPSFFASCTYRLHGAIVTGVGRLGKGRRRGSLLLGGKGGGARDKSSKNSGSLHGFGLLR